MEAEGTRFEAQESGVLPAGTSDPGRLSPLGMDGHWTPARRKLLAWFERVAPQLAPVYEGAVRMAEDDGFPGRVVFVWHAVREIHNRLPDVVAERVTGPQMRYGALAEDIRRCWVEDGLPHDGSLPVPEAHEPGDTGPERYEISRELLVAIGRLITGHEVVGMRSSEKAKILLEALGGPGTPDYAVRVWSRTAKNAHKLAHVGDRQVDPKDETELARRFSAFEEFLTALTRPAYELMDELDELLADANRR